MEVYLSILNKVTMSTLKSYYWSAVWSAQTDKE